MAYSEYPTQLSVDRFSEIVGIHNFHLNQIKTPVTNDESRAVGCDAVIYQHRYQSNNGTPGRSDIAREINAAERDIEAFVHFPLIKRWITNERIPLIHGLPFHLAYGYVNGIGVRASTLVEADVSISTEDIDEDGFEETAVITTILDQATFDALGDPEELRIFYPERSGDPVWEIRPVTVEIDATTREATIRCSISQLVASKWYERMIPGVLDPDDDIYLDAVDIYRVVNDSDVGGAYRIFCGGDSATFSTAGLTVVIDDNDGGIARVARPFFGWDLCACADPSARLSYVAGFPGSTFTRMDPRLERAVSILALSRLGGICRCVGVPAYNRDLSITGTTTSSGPGLIESTRWAPKPPDRVMKNPFGTSEGDRIAWDIIVTEILGETANAYR